MAAKIKPCTAGAKHKWEWVKDKTLKSGTFGAGGVTMRISRRGVYKCACGEAKYGEARSGL